MEVPDATCSAIHSRAAPVSAVLPPLSPNTFNAMSPASGAEPGPIENCDRTLSAERVV